MSSFGNFFLLSLIFFSLVSYLFICFFEPLMCNPAFFWFLTSLTSGYCCCHSGEWLCSISLSSTQSQRQMITYHYQHCTLWWLCNSLLYMWNAKFENHKPLMRVLSLAKRKNNSSRRLQSCQFSAYSQRGTIPLTLSTCFPAHSPVLSVVFRKISHEGHVLLFFIPAMASPLPSSSFSVLSNSSVLTVAAYLLHSTLPWSLLHLQSLQDSIFTVSKMTAPYGREGKLGNACSEHGFVVPPRAVFGQLLCASRAALSSGNQLARLKALLSSSPTTSFLMD